MDNNTSSFYGVVQGDGGLATKCGSKSSGIRVSAQSGEGSVITDLYYNDEDELMVNISVNDSSSISGDTIFCGTFKEFADKMKG